MNKIISRFAGTALGGIVIGALSIAVLLPLGASAALLSNTFNIGTIYPVAGGSTSVSSTCGVAGANSTVGFSLTQNGVNVVLPTTFSTDSNGSFSGNVVFPSLYTSGPGVLVATCNRTGDMINSPVLTFSAQASSFFGMTATVPTVGGLFNLSGTCGGSNGVGSVQLSLNSNGNNYNLDNVDLSSDSTFTSSVIIPTNAANGPATLTAVCSNGNRFSSNVVIGEAAVTSFTFSTSPIPGSYTTISGNCTNVNSNANGTVGFSLMRSGSVTTLPATNTQTNASGFFSSSVFFPLSVGSSPANLVVSCPNNSTFSNLIVLGPITVVADPTNGVIMPVGGVNAGFGPKQTPKNPVSAEVLFVGGLLGLVVVSRKNFHAQK